MSDRLVPCPDCARHVRAREACCPFCRATIPASLRDAVAPRPPAVRLGRAALLALGTGAATVAAACGGNVEGSGGDHGVSYAPPYGVSPMEDGGDDGGDADASTMSVALYGGFSPEDASVTPHDASDDASSVPDADDSSD